MPSAVFPLLLLLRIAHALILIDDEPMPNFDNIPEEEIDWDTPTDRLPNIDLDALVYNLTKTIPWFKYVGPLTLDCAEHARTMDTLMESINALHNCMQGHYELCASEYADQTGCVRPHRPRSACGHVRMGYKNHYGYDPGLSCRWEIHAPGGFLVNLTIDQFYTEPSGDVCHFDYVDIFDGGNETAPHMGRWCGRHLRFMLYSTTDRVLITAVTDDTIPKYGFRAVYQVLDHGKGATLNDPVYLYNETSYDLGTILLEDHLPVYFEDILRPIYHYQWFIRTDVANRIAYNYTVFLAEGAACFIYAGTAFSMLLNTTMPEHLNTTDFRSAHTLDTHMMRIDLERPSLTDSTDFWMTYQAVQKLKPLSRYNSGPCWGSSHRHDRPAQLINKKISLGAPVEQTDLPVQCFWEFAAPLGEFIKINFKGIMFKGPNTRGCQDEGLLIIDGDALDPSSRRYGPYCYDDPKGFFSKHEGVTWLSTSTNKLTVVFYSFVDYDAPFMPWERGHFTAIVSSGDCVGFFQPCSNPSFTSRIETPYYSADVTEVDNHRHVEFRCDKTKCCTIQQLPVYGPLNPQSCSIRVSTEGDLILATSDFHTGVAASLKNMSETRYSCERIDNIHSMKPGGNEMHCKGTQVHLTYSSASPWAHGTFLASVRRSPCGYYEPLLHTENVFYPPCADALVPVKDMVTEVRYREFDHDPNTYFSFSFSYKGECPTDRCLHDVLELSDKLPNGQVISFAWSRMPRANFTYRSWISTLSDRNWTRTLQVSRDIKETCNVTKGVEDACQLKVHFKRENQENALLVDHEVKPTYCPEIWQQIGDACYRLVWPSVVPLVDNAPVEQVDPAAALSSVIAETKCRRLGGHLVAIDDLEEDESLWKAIYYDWWPKYLKYIPGVKIFHIGYRVSKRPGTFYWTNKHPVLMGRRWAIPNQDIDYWPDSARTGTTMVDFIRSDSVKLARRNYQPEFNKTRACVVIVVGSAHEQLQWMRVPCAEDFKGSVGICETMPIETADDIDAPLFFTDLFTDDQGRRVVNMSRMECAPGYLPFLETCLMVVRSHHRVGVPGEEVSLNTAPTGCMDLLKLSSKVLSDRVPRYVLPEYVNVPGLDYGSLALSSLSARARNERNDRLKELQLHEDIIRKRYNLDGGTYSFKSPATEDAEEANQNLQYSMREFRKFLHRLHHTHELGAVILRVGGDCSVIYPEKRELSPHYQWKYRDADACKVKTAKSFTCTSEPILTEENCRDSQFECKDDHNCVLRHHVCDGIVDCLDGTDESNCVDSCVPKGDSRPVNCARDCHAHNCTCSSMYFQCHSGGCIPISKICNFEFDCRDQSDEAFCAPLECKSGELMCDDRIRCYKTRQQCDFIQHCADGSDEKPDICNFKKGCPFFDAEDSEESSPYMNCSAERPQCMSSTMLNDLVPDCPVEEGGPPPDEPKWVEFWSQLSRDRKGALNPEFGGYCPNTMSSCDPHVPVCYEREKTCVYDIDPYGNHAPCRRGDHLMNCKEAVCTGMYKCPRSYCLPIPRICDGQVDCPNGEDEEDCGYYVCPGMFRCRGERRCLRQHQICDGVIDCVDSGDDEELCHFSAAKCPPGCVCLGYAISCVHWKTTELPWKVPKDVRVIVFTYSYMQVVPSMRMYQALYRLDLSHNYIELIKSQAFGYSSMLRELYLNDNRLDILSSESFVGLRNLVILDIRNNDLGHLGLNAFLGLDSLPILDLSDQEIRSIEEFCFMGLKSVEKILIRNNMIRTLQNKSFDDKVEGQDVATFKHLQLVDLRGNPIDEVETGTFIHLEPQVYLMTERFSICCLAPQLERCYPPSDEFSSCADLIENVMLQMMVMLMGLMSFFGNLIVFQQRLKHAKDSSSSILVEHLAFSDLLMGIYLIIISGADIFYRGTYMRHNEEWRGHWVCKTAGYLYQVSAMMSTFVLILMTWDRMYAVLPTCSKRGLNTKAVRGFLALAWASCLGVTVLPLLQFDYFGTVEFARNAPCILFNIIQGRRWAGWEFTVSVFVLLNSACYLFIAWQGGTIPSCLALQWAGWEFTVSVFVLLNSACYLFIACGYVSSYGHVLRGLESLNDRFADDTPEEEKELELHFRKNEHIITRRLFLVVTTSFVVWLPLVFLGLISLLDFEVNQVISAWVALCLIPLNSALNPFLYQFSAKPYRRRVDDLLANWTPDSDQEEEDIEHEDDEAEGITRAAMRAQAYQDAILRELM